MTRLIRIYHPHWRYQSRQLTEQSPVRVPEPNWKFNQSERRFFSWWTIGSRIGAKSKIPCQGGTQAPEHRFEMHRLQNEWSVYSLSRIRIYLIIHITESNLLSSQFPTLILDMHQPFVTSLYLKKGAKKNLLQSSNKNSQWSHVLNTYLLYKISSLTLFQLGGYQIDTCLLFSLYLLHGFCSE